MENSILETVKKMLGIFDSDNAFDQDLIVYINSAFTKLWQLGIPKDKQFVITGKNEKWKDINYNNPNIEDIITYIFLNVKYLFDPPTSSFVLDSIKESIKEFEWRINMTAEVDNPKIL